MMIASILALLIVSPVPPPTAVAIGWSVVHPPSAVVVAVAALVIAGARRRRAAAVSEVQFLAAVSAELRAGSSLRSALASAAAGDVDLALAPMVRMANAGMSVRALADALAEGMPAHGRVVATAVEVAALTGGATADVFASLARLASDEEALRRELRLAAAQAKASAWIVGGVPVAFLVWQGVTGRLSILASSDSGRWLLVVGLLLLTAGVATIWKMAAGAAR